MSYNAPGSHTSLRKGIVGPDDVGALRLVEGFGGPSDDISMSRCAYRTLSASGHWKISKEGTLAAARRPMDEDMVTAGTLESKK